MLETSRGLVTINFTVGFFLFMELAEEKIRLGSNQTLDIMQMYSHSQRFKSKITT